MSIISSQDYKLLIADGKSQLEFLFAYQLSKEDIEQPVREYKFHPTRRWRADFCWQHMKLIVEIEGGTYKKSRHTSAKGFKADCEKYNTAALNGWLVLRFDAAMVNNLEALNTTLNALDLLKDKNNKS